VTYHKGEIPACITHAWFWKKERLQPSGKEEGSPAEPYDRGWLVAYSEKLFS